MDDTNVTPIKKAQKNDPMTIKIMLGIMALFILLKLPEITSGNFFLYSKHNVNLYSRQVKIPDDYVAYDLSGKPHKMGELLGDKLTLLVFWATWCGYCAKEFPQIDKIIPELEERGVKILPIARGDDTPDGIAQFMERAGARNMQSYIATTPQLHKMLEVNAYPRFVLVNSKGLAFAGVRPDWETEDIYRLFDSLSKE